MTPSARRALRLASAVVALPLALVACGDDSDDAADPVATVGAPAASTPTTPAPSVVPVTEATAPAAGSRPAITVEAADASLVVPPSIPGGFVDLTIEIEPGQQAHNIVFARLNDGVTFAEVTTAPPEALLGLTSLEGGVIDPADGQHATLELRPGDYLVFDAPEGQPQAQAPTAVTAPAATAPEPAAEGTITLGPEFVFGVPANFDGTGLWRFENASPDQPHEAVFARLADGATAEDAIAWIHGGAQGPPPFTEATGSMGAIRPGGQGWVELAPEPGEYVLLCFIPGADGIPHVAKGMAKQVTVV